MSQNNIYQVNSESQIDEILQNNTESLIVLVFSISNPEYVPTNINLSLKKEIKRNISKKYKDVIFLYIDLNSYFEEKRIYTRNINVLPFASFIWRNQEFGNIKSVLPEYIDDVIPKIFSNIKTFLELQKKEEHEKQLSKNVNDQSISVKNQPINNQPINSQQLNQAVNNQQVNQNVNNQSINNQPINNQQINQPIISQSINSQQVNQPINNQQTNDYNETINMDNNQQCNNVPNLINEQIDQNQLMMEMQQVQEQLNHQERMKKIEELRKKLAFKELEKVIKLKEQQESNKIKKNNK